MEQIKMFTTDTARILALKLENAPWGYFQERNGRVMLAKALRLIRKENAEDARYFRDLFSVRMDTEKLLG